MVNRRKDGSLYHEEQTIAPVVDEAGQPPHFIAIKRDVSAEKSDPRRPRDGPIEELGGAAPRDRVAQPATARPGDPRPPHRASQPALPRGSARPRGGPASPLGRALAVVALDLDQFKADQRHPRPRRGRPRTLPSLAAVLRAQRAARGSSWAAWAETSSSWCSRGPGCATPSAREQWRSAVDEGAVESDEGVEVRCTVSIGVAEHRRSTHETIAEALRRADAALYEAKRRGRDRVVAAQPPASPA